MQAIKVSAVLVVRNEERYIKQCIDSILASHFPVDELELLVVDGMSSDRSREIIAESARHHPNVRLLDNPARITPVGLNIGVKNARGAYIVILGAHCEYPPEYISTCVRELERTGADVVGGTLVTRPGAATAMAEAIARATEHRFGVGNSSFRLGRGEKFVDTVPYGMYRRELFERLGLFREDLVRAQDFEFNSRVRAAGGRLYLISRPTITYYNVPTFRAFLRQAYNKGIWVARSWFGTASSFCLRHAAPAAFVSGLAILFTAGVILPPAAKLGLALLGIYLLLAIASALQVASKVRYAGNALTIATLLPIVFLGYHVTYGIGTLVALLSSPTGKKTAPAPIVMPSPVPSNDLVKDVTARKSA